MPIEYRNLPTLILQTQWELRTKPFKMFGSRVLNVETRNSDYDVYVNVKHLDLFALKQYRATNSKYLNTPKHGDVILFKDVPAYVKQDQEYITLDILAFTDDHDVTIMDNVLTIMKNTIAYNALLKPKQTRIALFVYGLQKYGFTLSKSNKQLLQNQKKQGIDVPTLWELFEYEYKHANSNKEFISF